GAAGGGGNPKGPGPGPAVRAKFWGVSDALTHKFVALGEAFPAEKYSWSPGEGVRSIREVLNHVTDGNYSFMAMAGTPYPAGLDGKTIAALTDKATIVDALKQSFDHVRGIYGGMSDADF